MIEYGSIDEPSRRLQAWKCLLRMAGKSLKSIKPFFTIYEARLHLYIYPQGQNLAFEPLHTRVCDLFCILPTST